MQILAVKVFQLKQEETWKNSGLNGNWTHDLCDTGGGPFHESPDNFSSPGKLFYVRDVCIKDSNFVGFESWSIKF